MTRQQIERAQYAVKVLHSLETSPPASDGRVQRLLDGGHAAVWNAYQNALTKDGVK